jgi:hypothetical protein
MQQDAQKAKTILSVKQYCESTLPLVAATVLNELEKGQIPQDNFGKQYRLRHRCNLSFTNRDSYD